MNPVSQSVLICEQAPYWTPELQRQFSGSAVVVRGCRKWAELAELSRSSISTVEIVELEQCAADCVKGLRQRWRARVAPLIVIASARYADWEGVLREAGVQAFFPEPPTGAELARCCRRWLNA